MRESIKKILLGMVFFIFCYGVIANINHVISINKKYTYNFNDSVEIVGIKESYLLLNDYIEKIKKLENSKLGDDVIEAYTKSLQKISDNMANFTFMSYKGNVDLKQNDLYQIMNDYGKISHLDMLNMYKKLGQNYSNISINEKQFTHHIYNMLLTSNYVYETLVDNYSYSTRINHDTDFTVMTILSLFQEKLNTINYVNELVISTGTVNEDTTIESGEINE